MPQKNTALLHQIGAGGLASALTGACDRSWTCVDSSSVVGGVGGRLIAVDAISGEPMAESMRRADERIVVIAAGGRRCTSARQGRDARADGPNSVKSFDAPARDRRRPMRSQGLDGDPTTGEQ